MPFQARSRQWSPPVAKLLEIGRPGAPADLPDDEFFDWSAEPVVDYAAMGLSAAHRAELAALAADRSIIDGPPPECYGPVHATRALVALGLPEAIPALLATLRSACRAGHDAWIEDIVGTHGLPRLGPAILDPVAQVVRDQREDFVLRICLLGALDELAHSAEHAEQARPRVVALMRDMLRLAAFNDPAINGSLIGSLSELRAVDALPGIRAAFLSVNRSGRTKSGMGGVDEMCCGTLEHVERYIEMSDLDRLREGVKTSERIITEIKEMVEGRNHPKPHPRLPLGDDADDLLEPDDDLDLGFTEEDLQRAMERHAELQAELARAEREASQHPIA